VPHQPEQVVYRYVESGIPVILVIETAEGRHSVVVVGHTFDPHTWWPDAETNYFPFLSEDKPWLSAVLWSPQFVILDDNFGPYLNMSREALRSCALGAVVPLPTCANVFLTPEDAETIAAYALYHEPIIRAFIGESNTSDWKEHIYARQRDKNLVLRTLLLHKDDLLKDLPSSIYSGEVLQELNAKGLPDWVWLIEVSTPDMYGAQLKLGELILDPRVPVELARETGVEPVLALHLPGFLVLAPHQRRAEPRYPEGDGPRPVYARFDYSESRAGAPPPGGAPPGPEGEGPPDEGTVEGEFREV
jgi:hypothetical protein